MNIFRDNDLKKELKKNGKIKLRLPEKLDSRYISFGLVEMEPCAITEAHFHNKGEEFFQVISGNAEILLDDQKYSIKSGDIIFIKENVRHQIFNDTKDMLYLIFGISPPLKLS